ncbi:hypothetical protein [Nonomuraea sp. NPDC052265]|uniref:hypothetical protein n=1 Tax=Nonomuraea sp. NPDC052265 TaxID=3364374 RepID=UPI0037C885AB
MNEQDKLPEDLPPAVGRVNGESDTTAARASVEVRDAPRPIPAEPVEPPPDPEEKVARERHEVAEDSGEHEDPDPEPTG